ncbi:MAG: hypothetical protein M3457_08615 [Chloroflexota bacterium]|nr:hypothetical protein [Chloroflexota bacterium]
MNAKIYLSSRRGYYFPQDAIRLTTLSVRGIIDTIRSNFGFEFAEITSPPPIFGEVVPTNPPGLVFGIGVTPHPEQGTAFRSLTIDPRRIVLDVAGPSSVLSPTFDHFIGIVNGIKSADGVPPIGEPIRHQDYSELVIVSKVLTTKVVRPRVAELVAEKLLAGQDDRILVPTVRFTPQLASGEYLGSNDNDYSTMRLELRAGTVPSEGVLFSSAPLPSDEHLELLQSMEQNLS